MDFEILVDDLYLKIFADTALAPAENKSVLSLLNDFEDQAWRYEKFEDFIWNNIALTALSAHEREKLTGQSRTTLRESARKLRLTDKADDIGAGTRSPRTCYSFASTSTPCSSKSTRCSRTSRRTRKKRAMP